MTAVPLFDLAPAIPGFVYLADAISSAEEAALLHDIQALQFRSVVMHGVTAKRRIVQFGQHYTFQSRTIAETDPVPDFLLPVRRRLAALTSEPPEAFAEALVTEYAPGAGIGWHVDAPPFGVVLGLSLLGGCRLKLRPVAGDAASIVTIDLAPRSAYVFSGAVRWQWRHSIPPTKVLRYSVTFRTLVRR